MTWKIYLTVFYVLPLIKCPDEMTEMIMEKQSVTRIQDPRGHITIQGKESFSPEIGLLLSVVDCPLKS